MSGGVDSAVALLRAAPQRGRRDAAPLARSGRARRRARVLLAGRRHRRARDLPRARAAARDARPARGVPPRGRRRRSCAATRAARRRTRASAATAASASPSCSRSRGAPAPRGSRPATTRASSSSDGRLLLARAADPRRISRYMLAPARPAHARPHLVPARRADKDETRAEAERAGLAAARRAESQEACFLAGDDYRSFLARHGLAAKAGAIVDEHGDELGAHDGFWRFTPGQRRGLGVAAARAALRARRRRARRTPSSSARASRSRARASPRAGGLYVDVEPRRGEAPLPLARGRRRRSSRPRARLPRSSSTSRRTASRPARRRSSTTATPSSAAGVDLVRRRRLRSRRDARRRFTSGDLWRLALAVFLLAVGLSLRVRFSSAWAEPLRAFPR